MNKLRAKLRTVAIAIGILATLVLAPLAFIWTMFTLSQTSHFSLLTGWGPIGLSGLVAFWCWALWRRPIAQSQRVLFSAFICAGLVAVAPFAAMDRTALIVGGLGGLGGVIAILDMWLPNNSLEADRGA